MPKHTDLLLRSARTVAQSSRVAVATGGVRYVHLNSPNNLYLKPQQSQVPRLSRSFVSSARLRNDYAGGQHVQELEAAERALKESLVSHNGEPVDRQEVRQRLMDLINMSPGNVVRLSVVPVVKSAYYELFQGGAESSVMTPADTKRLFAAVAGNDPKDVQDFPFVLAVYHQAEQAAQTQRDSRDNILLLGKYFLHQDRLDNFWKLLEAQIKSHEDVDAAFVRRLIELISIAPHLTLRNVARALDLRTELHIESSNELRDTLARTLESLYFKEKEGSDFFLTLVEEHILDQGSDYVPSDNFVAMTLSNCVNEGREELGRRLLDSHVIQRFDSLDSAEEDPQNYYAFWASAAIDLRAPQAEVKRIIRRLQAEPERTKATWDTVARYSAYKADLSNRTDLLALRQTLSDMQTAGFEPDAETYFEVYRTCSQEPAVRSAVVYLFENELDIEKDTSIFAIMIDKALKQNETLTALECFTQSFEEGAQWENKKLHMEPLTELLVQYAGMADTSVADILQLVQRIEPICKRIPYAAETAIARNVLVRHHDVPNFYTFMNRQYGKTAKDVVKIDPIVRPNTYKVVHDYVYSSEPSNSENAWEMYGLLHKFYVVPFADYYKAIKFFAQDVKRQDFALLTFQQIRKNHDLHGQPPATSEMVAFLFHEFSKTKYKRGIKRLHEVVALEVSFDVNRDVLNEMMAAYVSIEDINRIQDCWLQIQQLPPSIGANNRSVDVLLSYFKDNIQYTERTWQGIPAFGLLPTLENYEQYLINNCRTGNYRRALSITKKMEIESGLKPTPKILAAIYNYTFNEPRKLEIRQWAEEAHPEEWKKLEESNSLKELCLPENINNDSVESLLKEASAEMEEELSGSVVKVE